MARINLATRRSLVLVDAKQTDSVELRQLGQQDHQERDKVHDEMTGIVFRVHARE